MLSPSVRNIMCSTCAKSSLILSGRNTPTSDGVVAQIIRGTCLRCRPLSMRIIYDSMDYYAHYFCDAWASGPSCVRYAMECIKTVRADICGADNKLWRVVVSSGCLSVSLESKDVWLLFMHTNTLDWMRYFCWTALRTNKVSTVATTMVDVHWGNGQRLQYAVFNVISC